MLRIMLFNRADNLYRSLAGLDAHLRVVTPSPDAADAFRRKLAHAKCDVVTISKFFSDELERKQLTQTREGIKSKSELILLLSAVWRRFWSSDDESQLYSYDGFSQAFKQLTDLRSFSLDDEVLQGVMEHLDENMARAIMWMHKAMEQLDIYDEHRVAYELAQAEAPEEDVSPLVFLGFDFFSASQIDLIKSYAAIRDVYIPIYEEVYKASTMFDWPTWLEAHESVVQTIDDAREKPHVKFSSYPKNYLSKSLRDFVFQNALQSSPCEIVIADNRSSLESVQQVNLGETALKVGVDLLYDKIEALFYRLKNFDSPDAQRLAQFLQKLYTEAIQEQDFRSLKAIQLIEQALGEWTEINGNESEVSGYDLRVLKEVVVLDAPRISQINLTNEKINRSIKNLKNLYNLESSASKIFCLSSKFSGPQGAGTQYTQGLEKALCALGPLRRSEFDRLHQIEKILDNMDEKTHLLVEAGLFDHDENWQQALEKVSIEDVSSSVKIFSEKKQALADHDLGESKDRFFKLSASRLQAYIDCPKKYYYQYVLRYAPKVVLPDKVDLLEQGRLQHKTIEEYVTTYKSYEPQAHIELIDRLIVREFDKSLSYVDAKALSLETFSLTRGIIDELVRIKSQADTEVLFEQPLPKHSALGSIDCVIRSPEGVMLIDFKRGKSSIPSQKAFRGFEKIQLWFYLNHYPVNQVSQTALGYVCLSEPQASLIHYFSADLYQNYVGGFQAKNILLTDKFQEHFAQYQAYEEELKIKMQNTSAMLAMPSSSGICSFCSFSNICPRQERINNGEG